MDASREDEEINMHTWENFPKHEKQKNWSSETVNQYAITDISSPYSIYMLEWKIHGQLVLDLNYWQPTR